MRQGDTTARAAHWFGRTGRGRRGVSAVRP